MYPSGTWDGFWVQEHYGRQPMTEFALHFAGAEVTGGGRDVIGRFTFSGACDPDTGEVLLVKQYVGKHRVVYRGRSDGEGSIAGTWSISPGWSGPFVMRPVVPRPRGDEPIREIG